MIDSIEIKGLPDSSFAWESLADSIHEIEQICNEENFPMIEWSFNTEAASLKADNLVQSFDIVVPKYLKDINRLIHSINQVYNTNF